MKWGIIHHFHGGTLLLFTEVGGGGTTLYIRLHFGSGIILIVFEDLNSAFFEPNRNPNLYNGGDRYKAPLLLFISLTLMLLSLMHFILLSYHSVVINIVRKLKCLKWS